MSRYNPVFGGGRGAAEKALAGMKEQYGSKEKAEQVFYAMVNKKRPGLIKRGK